MNRLTPADHRNGKSGATLNETMIVLLLIGTLAGAAFYTFPIMTNKARTTQAIALLDSLTKTEATHFGDHELYTDNFVQLKFDPAKKNYYEVSVVLLDNGMNYRGTAKGVGVMAGDSWTITKDGQPVQDRNSRFR